VVFPEAFVPGPPVWIDALPVGEDGEWHTLLLDQSVVVPGPACDQLGAIARMAGVVLVVGIDEREPHGGTVYNSVLTFGPDGQLLGRHRKLMPTHAERLVWGMGDGSDLQVLDSPAGRLATLICWENYMPLARFHLYAQGPELWSRSHRSCIPIGSQVAASRIRRLCATPPPSSGTAGFSTATP
jgi:predicted amidohydrolase